MDRTFTTTRLGPTSLTLPHGMARVTVDPAAKAATVLLHTDDADGWAVDAISQAETSSAGGLSVTVPDLAGAGSYSVAYNGGSYQSVTVSGSSNVVMSGGGRVTVNGRVVSDGAGAGRASSGIIADVTLPPGTGLVFSSNSASVRVSGPLAGLSAHTVSGDVEAGVVGVLRVNTTSGDIEVTAVTEEAHVVTVSGDIDVGMYRGRQALLQAVSGDIALSATSAATGGLSATSVSGDIRLRGAGHLNPRAHSVSGRVRA